MTELAPELVGKEVKLHFEWGEVRRMKLVMYISHPKGRCYIFGRRRKGITENAFEAIRTFMSFCRGEEKP